MARTPLTTSCSFQGVQKSCGFLAHFVPGCFSSCRCSSSLWLRTHDLRFRPWWQHQSGRCNRHSSFHRLVQHWMFDTAWCLMSDVGHTTNPCSLSWKPCGSGISEPPNTALGHWAGTHPNISASCYHQGAKICGLPTQFLNRTYVFIYTSLKKPRARSNHFLPHHFCQAFCAKKFQHPGPWGHLHGGLGALGGMDVLSSVGPLDAAKKGPRQDAGSGSRQRLDKQKNNNIVHNQYKRAKTNKIINLENKTIPSNLIIIYIFIEI